MDIIAYQYEADTHCIPCTVKRFAYSGTPKRDHNTTHSYDSRQCCELHFKPMCDQNEIHVNQIDSEGNLIHPLFSTDEWQEMDEAYIRENPVQYLPCGTCHEIIEEYLGFNHKINRRGSNGN